MWRPSGRPKPLSATAAQVTWSGPTGWLLRLGATSWWSARHPPPGDVSQNTVIVWAGRTVQKNLTSVLHVSSAATLTDAPLRPTALAVGPTGDLFIADPQRNQILERHPDATFTVFAGNGRLGFAGDGGLAASAELDDPSGMTFGADGILYFADQGNGRVRAISPAGVITTVVGDGEPGTSHGFVTDGGPALRASLTPYAVALGPSGRLYIATGEQVLRLNPDGPLTVVFGDASSHPNVTETRVITAMCDIANKTLPTVQSASQLAAAYYGWGFASDPAFAQWPFYPNYSSNECGS